MEEHSHLGAAKGWLTYDDPQGRYALRFPHEWEVQRDTADRTVIKEPGSRAEFLISYLAEDCAVAQSKLRGRRLNYYFLREFTRSIAGREALTLEFRDTVSNVREFRALFPAERGCCELKWTRAEGSQGIEFESTLETMLSTFDFVSKKS
jgi:hypothetical protein